jgi:ABC-type enterobactin transport system permease subunit
MDISVFGPLMIFSAINKTPPPWLRLAMVGIGVGTILYNAKNFLTIENKLQK